MLQDTNIKDPELRNVMVYMYKKIHVILSTELLGVCGKGYGSNFICFITIKAQQSPRNSGVKHKPCNRCQIDQQEVL